MIGLPACGKSTYAKTNYPIHILVSLDQIPNHNRKLELEFVEENLREGNSVVVADTNATKKIRAEYVKLAKKYESKLTAVHIDYPLPFAIYRNDLRDKPVSRAAIFKINKILESPSYEEGFDEIITKTLND